MRTIVATSILALGIGVGACDLTGPDLSESPNDPTQASNTSLFSSAQAALWVQSESDVARSVCVWLQQCAGRLSQYNAIDNYSIGDGDFWYADWSRTYGGGGLIDLRLIESNSVAVGDSTFAGIASVVEAWFVGTAADVWGDIPYTQAVNPAITAPALDPQQEVYDSVQAKLNTAIALLGDSLSPRNVGPGVTEPVYGGSRAEWIRLAYTLKARNFMHTAGQIALSYDSVLKYAPLGILQGEDYNNAHTAALPLSNIWFQFFSSAALDYVAAGQFGVDLLCGVRLPNNTCPAPDPRLPEYYSPSPADPAVYQGGGPGQSEIPALTAGTISSLSATRLAPDFQQPLVTWAEGQLLLAEAYLQSPTASNPGLALTTLNTVRATVPLLPVPGGLTNAQLLDSIMIEKYKQEFQNIEAWSDYRRTCIPTLSPAPGYPNLPTRLPYPLSERNANPSIPNPGPDPFTGGNPNSPTPCP